MASSAPPNLPPRPAPKPGQVKVVRAVFDYQARADDELSFSVGDMLFITDQTSSQDWWKAICNGKSGLVPSNYVSHNTEAIDNPLHEAAKRGNLEFLAECVGNKVSVNGLDKAGSTPLHWSAFGGHLECAKLLLDSNAVINPQNKMGDTPLHLACRKNRPELVKLFLDRGATLDIVNNDGMTPMKLTFDPECLALLRAKLQPRASQNIDEYGGDSDSD